VPQGCLVRQALRARVVQLGPPALPGRKGYRAIPVSKGYRAIPALREPRGLLGPRDLPGLPGLREPPVPEVQLGPPAPQVRKDFKETPALVDRQASPGPRAPLARRGLRGLLDPRVRRELLDR
jgi:hypothetical protein